MNGVLSLRLNKLGHIVQEVVKNREIWQALCLHIGKDVPINTKVLRIFREPTGNLYLERDSTQKLIRWTGTKNDAKILSDIVGRFVPETKTQREKGRAPRFSERGEVPDTSWMGKPLSQQRRKLQQRCTGSTGSELCNVCGQPFVAAIDECCPVCSNTSDNALINRGGQKYAFHVGRTEKGS